jgi:hypothetical protein
MPKPICFMIIPCERKPAGTETGRGPAEMLRLPAITYPRILFHVVTGTAELLRRELAERSEPARPRAARAGYCNRPMVKHAS